MILTDKYYKNAKTNVTTTVDRSRTENQDNCSADRIVVKPILVK